jgi:hypothetical protein
MGFDAGKVATEIRRSEMVQQLLEGNTSPETLARVLTDMTTRIAVVEHQLAVAEHDRVALQAEREAMRRSLLDARHQADRAAATAALLQAQAKERVRPGHALCDAGDEYGNLRPDPRGARTAAELIGVLRRFRTWAGNPSYREMARCSGRRAGASTMCTVLGGSQLPARFDVVDAIVEGCGGSEEDRQRFATAWRLRASPPSSPPLLRAVQVADLDGEDAYAKPLASNS